jgi:Flp pilus assembly protein TadG
MRTSVKSCQKWLSDLRVRRRGVFIVVLAVSLAACLAFVAFSVDTGLVVLTQTRMQNCVDAAALAAASEITYAVQNAGANVSDVTAYAMDQARLKAQQIGTMNNVYIDPAVDVRFGRRQSTGNGQFSITWDVTPANAVKVTARRTNNDTSKPDGKLKTMFASVFGPAKVGLTTEATAYIESRDIGLVLDFSSSMNDDSSFDVVSTRSRAALDANMLDIYNILASNRSLTSMAFTPQWYNRQVNAASPDTRWAKAVFKNTSVDVTASNTMSSILLTYTDNSTGTFTGTGTAQTLTGSKSIQHVQVTIPGQTPSGSSTGANGARSATVTFNNSSNNNISVTGSSFNEILLTYAGGTTQTFTFTSTTSRTVTGSGLYVVSARVKFVATGSPTVTINNPSGTTQPSNFSSVNIAIQTTDANIQSWLGLPAYPWASGSWTEFFSYCRTDSQVNTAGHRYKYGGACLVNYLLKNKYMYSQCNDLWRTPHYPFHSVKQGAMLFCDFIEDLGFGDEVGAVSFDVNSRREETLGYDGYNINIATNPVCNDYESVRQIIRHRQAAHYSSNTNTGAGISCGKLMLDASKRAGTQPTLLIMTDGLPTAQDSGWTFPSNWNWNALFDYDGDGVADYTTSDTNSRYALMRAKEAVDAGYTIHTMTVGLGGDPNLMAAIAHLGKGITIVVPGDQTVAEMEADVIAGFQKIAAFVPPAKLVKPE